MNKRKKNGNFEKIDELYAWISSDEEGEGLCGAMINGQMMPLVGADRERIESYRPYAVMAKQKPVRLVRFWNAEVLEKT